MSSIAEAASMLWLPGWSFGPEIWREAIEQADPGEHRAVDFAAARRPDDLLVAARSALDSLDRPVRLVGWSLGAMVALEVARDLPERVSALILVSASDGFVGAAGGGAGWSADVLEAMSVRLDDDPSGVLASFDRRLFSRAERRAGCLDRWSSEAPLRSGAPNRIESLDSLRAGLDYLGGFAFEPGSLSASIPTFLLHGSDDAICPLAGAQRLAAALPQAAITVWDGAGHLPFWTDPDRFAEWLRRCTTT